MYTEKQINYAKDIRAKFIASAEEVVSKLTDDMPQADRDAAVKALALLRSYSAERNAAWWINRRHHHVYDVMEQALNAEEKRIAKK